MYIVEHCQIHNVKNDIRIWIGNCCVKWIGQEAYEKLKRTTSCLHRISNNINNTGSRINDDVIEYGTENKILTDIEADFLRSIGRKKLSEKQEKWLKTIKSKLLRSFYKGDTEKLHTVGINATNKCDCGKYKKEIYDACWKCNENCENGCDVDYIEGDKEVIAKCPKCSKNVPQTVLDCNEGLCMNCAVQCYSNVYLDVSYTRKDEAKDLGAKWDGNVKKWYISGDSPNVTRLLQKFKEVKWENKINKI